MMTATSAGAPTRPPVLVLTGVGLSAAVVLRFVGEIERHFPVLALPAGEGGTSGDALALLDAAGADRVHIFGLSFGATIAQEIAFEHPERVRTLVLASSTAGGERYAAPERAVRDFLYRLHDLPTEEGLWASVPYFYAATTVRRNALLIGEDIAQRLGRPLDPRSYRRQHGIARAHDAGARLAAINAPTLVLHGEEDRILPLENGRRLAEAIAGANFMPVRGAAHAFPTDVPGASRELVSFLLANSPRRAGRGTRTGRATRA